MKRYRKSLSIFLGLVILFQGVAVAAGPFSVESPEPDAMAAMDAGMPCHGQNTSDATPEDTQGCCDTNCPDMLNCMLGQLAPVPNHLWSNSYTPDRVSAQIVLRFDNLTPTFILRPPISLHT